MRIIWWKLVEPIHQMVPLSYNGQNFRILELIYL